jgi:NADPH:quinone reductase-like Zn-dependent oxidoreductase
VKAVHHSNYRLFDELRICEVPKPEVGDITVRMKAAGINIADCFSVLGKPFPIRLMLGLTKPTLGIPGMDGTGVVESVSSNIKKFKPGDEVFGSTLGTCAEYAVFKENQLVHKPRQLSFEEAAAMPISALAALHGLRDCMKIKPSDKILINGASGGVGCFAVQLANQMGAEVTAVCSSRNIEMMQSLGAHHVMDYSKEDFIKSGKRWDFILDNVENRTIQECRKAPTERGTLVLNSGTGSEGLEFFVKLIKPVLLSGFLKQNLRRYVSSFNADDMVHLGSLAAVGKLKVMIERVWPLTQTAEALTHVYRGHTRGRVVITI